MTSKWKDEIKDDLMDIIDIFVKLGDSASDDSGSRGTKKQYPTEELKPLAENYISSRKELTARLTNLSLALLAFLATTILQLKLRKATETTSNMMFIFALCGLSISSAVGLLDQLLFVLEDLLKSIFLFPETFFKLPETLVKQGEVSFDDYEMAFLKASQKMTKIRIKLTDKIPSVLKLRIYTPFIQLFLLLTSLLLVVLLFCAFLLDIDLGFVDSLFLHVTQILVCLLTLRQSLVYLRKSRSNIFLQMRKNMGHDIDEVD